jgi:hypothetical protein
MDVKWIKSKADTWLSFEVFDLTAVTTFGVYVIWHSGNPARTVRVGQGDIKSRLGAHRNDREICQYARSGALYVTWATVPKAQVDGVERYLANWLTPLVGDAFPDVLPIAVNSPWS